MATTRATLERAAQRIIEQLAELDEREKAFGPEPVKDGAVIRFRRRGSNGTGYYYAGIRAGGLWYLTGGSSRTPQRMTWEALVSWMSSPQAGLPRFTGSAKDFQVIHPGGRWKRPTDKPTDYDHGHPAADSEHQ